jgi:hypothetical protein
MSNVTRNDVATAVTKFVEAEKVHLEHIGTARDACFKVTIQYLETVEGVS